MSPATTRPSLGDNPTSRKESACAPCLSFSESSPPALRSQPVAAALERHVQGQERLLVYQGIVGEHEQLLTVKPDGSDVRQLTDFSDSDAINASWSPDSRKIAFLRRWGQNKWRVYTMNADGSGKREFHRTLRGTPAWLPDGKHLLLLKRLTWTIVNANGGAPRDAGIPGTHGDAVPAPGR